MKIGIIGCGNMGGGMVAHPFSAGRDVRCCDPNTTTRARTAAIGARSVGTATELVAGLSIINPSLPKVEIVEAVMTEIATHIDKDAIALDTSTSKPTTSQAMAELGKHHGFAFIDGPVSGGPAAANSGTTTMLLAGDQER